MGRNKTEATIIYLLLVMLLSCSKDRLIYISKEQEVVNYLTAFGNRYWYLEKIFQNDNQIVLTQNQTNLGKIYTIYDGMKYQGFITFTDGIKGEWVLLDIKTIKETFASYNGTLQSRVYTINVIDNNMLDIEYIQQGTKIREVYHSF